MSDNKDIILKIDSVNKSFIIKNECQHVLNDIYLEVDRGKVLCLLGYSGCGKTTLLRIISALEVANSGTIFLDDQIYQKPSKDILLLFQDFNQLFSWKSVISNIIHSIRITNPKIHKNEAKNIAEEILKEVGLLEFKNRYPQQLSGGMKQRAAVARALAVKPKVLLMDEPFASLDMVTRYNLQKLVKEQSKKYGITVIFVTHSVEEAVLIGDKIVIMKANPGRIGKIIENSYMISKDNRDKMKIMSIIMEELSSQIEEENGGDINAI